MIKENIPKEKAAVSITKDTGDHYVLASGGLAHTKRSHQTWITAEITKYTNTTQSISSVDWLWNSAKIANLLNGA